MDFIYCTQKLYLVVVVMWVYMYIQYIYIYMTLVIHTQPSERLLEVVFRASLGGRLKGYWSFIAGKKCLDIFLVVSAVY